MSKAKSPDFTVGYLEPDKPGVFRELFAGDVEERLRNGDDLTILGLTSGEYAAGALVFEIEEEHLEIVSFYVAPEYRGKGGGKLLLDAVEGIAAKMDFWVSASFTVVNEDTELLEEAFLNAGYTLRDDVDYKTYVITLAECEDSESLKTVKDNPKLKHFCELTENKLKSYNKQAIAKLAPLPEGGLMGEKVDKDISTLFDESGRMKGFVAIENIEFQNGIRVSAAFNGSDNPLVLMWLLKSSLCVAEEKYDETIPLVIDVVDTTADRFVRYVLPDVVTASRTYDKVPEAE